MRKFLDSLYVTCGAIAAFFIAAICILVTTQVVFNLIGKLELVDRNLTIPSYSDFAGYFLATASFLALPYTLTSGGHIRVSLLIGLLSDKLRFFADASTLLIATLTSAFCTFYMAKLVLESHEFGDVSAGIIAVPLWIPQTGVTFGLLVLTIALLDLTWTTIRSGNRLLDNNE